MTTPEHKRGDSFSFQVAWARDGVPLPINGCTLASQARTSDGTLVADFVVAERNDVAGTAVFEPAEAYPTSGWPLKLVFIDVRLTRPDGVVETTETFQVQITRGITA